MVIFSLLEVIYLAIATLVVGFIFSGVIRKPSEDVFLRYQRFHWHDFWFATAVAAPGIILHELAHKFVAISFGINAFFTIWPTGLLLGIVLKLLGSGFMILAPGYVTISGASPLVSALTALAGPLTNLVLWLGTLLFLRYAKHITRSTALFLALTKEINKWLFVFNILPIPPLDGFNVVATLFRL